jgi:hypothetical protein
MARRPIYLKVCRISRYTRHLVPPAEFFRRRGIDDDASVEWIEEDDGSVRLKFMKFDPPLQMEPAE